MVPNPWIFFPSSLQFYSAASSWLPLKKILTSNHAFLSFLITPGQRSSDSQHSLVTESTSSNHDELRYTFFWKTLGKLYTQHQMLESGANLLSSANWHEPWTAEERMTLFNHRRQQQWKLTEKEKSCKNIPSTLMGSDLLWNLSYRHMFFLLL